MHKLKKLYLCLNKISDIICRVLEVILVLLVVINALDVFLQVFNRYVLVKVSSISVSWTEELARFSMVWICYTALSLCFREGSMAQVDIIYSKLNRRGRLLIYVITRILMILVIVVAVKYGLYICKIKTIYKSAMLRAPGTLLYAAPVVGSLLVAFEMVTEAVGVFSGILEPFEAGAKRGFLHHNEPEQDEEIIIKRKEDN